MRLTEVLDALYVRARLLLIADGEVAVVVDRDGHVPARGDVRPGAVRIGQGGAVLKQYRPLAVLRREVEGQAYDVARAGLRIGIRVARRGEAGVEEQARLPERGEALRGRVGAGVPGVLVRAYARGVKPVEAHGLEVAAELIGLALRRGGGVRVEVDADVIAVFPEIVELGAELLAGREILAVDGVVHAVLEAAADEVGEAVAVYVREAGHAVAAELGVIAALVVFLVELDVARGVEARAAVYEPGDISVEGADGEVGEAVAVEVGHAGREPGALHAEGAGLLALAGELKPLAGAVVYEQAALVRAEHEVERAVAVEVADVGQGLRLELRLKPELGLGEAHIALAAQEVDAAVRRAAEDVRRAVGVRVADHGRAVRPDGAELHGRLGLYAPVVAQAAEEVDASVRAARDEVEDAVAVEVGEAGIGALVILRVVYEIAAAVLELRKRQPLALRGGVRAGGIGALVHVHLKAQAVPALTE